MPSVYVALARIAGFFQHHRHDVEFHLELREHIAMAIDDKMRGGLPPEEARRTVLVELGGVTQLREEARAARGLPWLDGFLLDLKLAIRQLRRNTGFTIAAVVTLALGIGANAAMFSVVRGVLLRPLPNDDEAHLLYLRQSASGLGVENAWFSVPEINDLRGRLTKITRLAEFSTTQPTLFGLGEAREVRSGVVDGGFFEVMGLRASLGRLIGPADDGPGVPGVVVLTHRFWNGALGSDPTVVGKAVRLGGQSATVIGVLEPAAPYPEETEIIANMVTSPHHLSATMVTEREHRMTEVFGRMAPNTDLAAVRAELQTAYGGIQRSYPEIYTPHARFQLNVVPLREQLNSRATTILTVLLVAAGLIFVVACANVINLVLARTARRESELAVRAALLPSTMAVRRTLLVESLLLCGVGATAGVVIAQPMVSLLARFTARYSVRAVDFQLDATPLWIGVALALVAAVLLAFAPSLPKPGRAVQRSTGTSARRLQVFAIAQIAASFMLLSGAAAVVRTLLALEQTSPGFQTANVLAVNLPPGGLGRTAAETLTFYRNVRARLGELPDVAHVVIGSNVPWRDIGGGPTRLNPRPGGMQFTAEGAAAAPSGEKPQARGRAVSSGFFSALGIRILAGREFNDNDTAGAERVVIVSASVAAALFPGQDAVNRQFRWSDPVARLVNFSEEPRRIIGVVADIDDEQVDPQTNMTVYHPFEQEVAGGRLFVVTRGTKPYVLVSQVERIVKGLAPTQPVEQASTLEDIRAQVLSPARVNTIVLGVFAGVALLISVIGIGAVLAFSVSGRTREFGVRLAIGSPPKQLLLIVLKQGVVIVAAGIAAGVTLGWALTRVAGAYIPGMQLPGAAALTGATALLVTTGLGAALGPAIRAARTNPVRALKCE